MLRFLRSVRGNTRLDKIRSEVVRKELQTSGIQRRETQIHTKLDQPTRKNGQHHTPETHPQLQTSRKKRTQRWQCVDAGIGQTT